MSLARVHTWIAGDVLTALDLNAEFNNIVNNAVNQVPLASLTANSFTYLDVNKLLATTAAPTNGQLLVGSTGAVPVAAALTGTANQVVVTNGAGTITLSTPQSIAAASSPTFAALTLTAALTVPNGGTGVATLAANGILYGNGAGVVLATAQGAAGSLLAGNGGVPSFVTSATAAGYFTAATVQTFTSGSGTYTTPANCKRITVRLVGAGGGGSGGGGTPGAGGNGGDTTFSTMTGGGGPGSPNTGAPGAGGTAAGGDMNAVGSLGGPVQVSIIGTSNTAGAIGGNSPLSGAGTGSYNTTGSAAAANSGSGGGGGGASAAGTNLSGGGGSAGGYVEKTITSPGASYSYAVGAAGTAGTAGSNGFAGGAGGSGFIIVEEFYV